MLKSWSICLCAPGSDCSICVNRAADFECDDTNCAGNNGSCINRDFAKLEKRCKENDLGVEIRPAGHKGRGLWASRSFPEGHLLVEYAGDIMTSKEYESQTANPDEASSDEPSQSFF